MSSKTIVCAACNAAVPYGRLSCPSCGELLASVAGAARPMVGQHQPDTADPEAAPAVSDAALAASEAAPASVEPGMPAAVAVAATPAADLEAVAGEAPEWPESRPATPSATAVSSPYVADAPGAYVPPVVPATPAGPPALARAWAGHPSADATAAETDTGARASAAALMDGARLREFIGWLAVAGSAMAAVGFMLPWGISVIGATGVDYFDRWGLAGPFHPLVAVALLAILALALIRNPIPLWVRVGVPGLGLGALLIGLIWPYLVGLPGTGPGVLVVGLGAAILVVAGIGALAMDRHAAKDRAV